MKRISNSRRTFSGLLALLLPLAVLAAGPAKEAPPPKPHETPSAAAPLASPAPPAAPERIPAEEPETDLAGEPDLVRVHAQGNDKVAIGSDVDVPAGEEVLGGVVCIAGNARVAGKVLGDVVVIAGRLEMSGTSFGSVVGVGSTMKLEDSASVKGDLVNVMGSLERNSAEVGGQVFNMGFKGSIGWLPMPFGFFGFILFWVAFLKLVLVFVGLLLMAAFVPERVRVISQETPVHPFLAFAAGLGGYIALAVVLVLLSITIIGIPAAILLYFVFVVLKWMGLAGVFHFIGSRLWRAAFRRDVSLLGGMLVGFLPFAILRFLPFCIGGILWFVLGAVGIGFVILTRLGGRPYSAGVVTAPVVPPAPPPPLAG